MEVTLAILLPERSVNLKAVRTQQNIKLNWNAVDEANLVRYEIQSSADGVNFSTIAVMHPTRAQHYDFQLSDQGSAKQFYRIKLVFHSGPIGYSNTCFLKSDQLMRVKLLVNPVNGYAQLFFDQGWTGKVQLGITDMNGRIVLQGEYQLTGRNLNIPVQHLKPGMYVISVRYDQQVEKLSMLVVR